MNSKHIKEVVQQNILSSLQHLCPTGRKKVDMHKHAHAAYLEAMLTFALDRSKGDKSRAAKILGVNRMTVYNWQKMLDKYYKEVEKKC